MNEVFTTSAFLFILKKDKTIKTGEKQVPIGFRGLYGKLSG